MNVEIASLAREAASPLAPNSRRGISKSGASVSASGFFVAVLKMGSTTEMKKTIKSL
jgi:hypothetical protein